MADHSNLRQLLASLDSEKWKLVPDFLRAKGLVKQHLDSFNYFIEQDLKDIVRANARVDSDIDPAFHLSYTNIYVGWPCVEENLVTHDITPQQCRLRDLTYAAPIMVDLQYVRGKQLVVRKGVCIGRMPIMLRSSKCILVRETLLNSNSKHGQASIESLYARLGECPLDPGGYFIIRGTEKVILVQEQLSKNRILVDQDRKGGPIASVTSSTHERKSKTYVALDKQGRLCLRHNSLHEDIPLVVVLKALGITSDRDVLLLVAGSGDDKTMIEAFAPSIELAAQLGIVTPEQALEFIGQRSKIMVGKGRVQQQNFNKSSPVEDARELLATVVVSHVSCTALDMKPKAIYLALMGRRLLQTKLGLVPMDDRDYVGNKRLELAGQLLALLFEDCFKRFNGELKRNIDRVLGKPNRAQEFDAFPLLKLQTSIITLGLERAIATGNWTVRRFKMERAGITQVLSRLSYIAALGMMTRITSQFEKTRKVSGPRSLQPSQWGVICPSDTPEGEACGLVKNLALMAHVTTDVPDGDQRLSQLLWSLGVQPVAPCLVTGAAACQSWSPAKPLPLSSFHSPDTFLCHLNGIFVGIIQGRKLANRIMQTIRAMRRHNHLLDPFISVSLNEIQGVVHVSTDSGRICRPLIVFESPVTAWGSKLLEMLQTMSSSSATSIIDHRVSDPRYSFEAFLKQGLIEYLDVNEENDSLIAIRAHKELVRDGCQVQSSSNSGHYTHLEIDPMTILGAVAGLIPFPHHNQSPRNTYQCAMGKQAIGVIGFNQQQRFDSLLYLLVYPQKPLVTTHPIEMIGYDRMPAGTNAIVAVMSYSGYDIEDALILNRASLDRGFGRVLVMRKYGTTLRKYPDGRVDRVLPANPDPSTGQIPFRFDLLDQDGVACPGERVLPGQIYINKHIPGAGVATSMSNLNLKPTPLSHRGPVPCYVDKVLLSMNEDQILIKTLLRQTRRPEIGDKFSSRHGQKGVCGLIVPSTDMPFCTDSGISCDIVMNPHGFPSRMTIGKMLELLAGKAVVVRNAKDKPPKEYGTVFSSSGQNKVDQLGADLVAAGFSYSGKDFVTSGITGEILEAHIFFGPVYYQRLKHMVVDKMHARARGPRAVLTRQPTEGRSRDGGLRLGEMERDCLISYGASNLVVERLMDASDAFVVFVCKSCGLISRSGWCKACQSGQLVESLRMPYACKLLFQELQAMNIAPRLQLEAFQ